jgi:hypothetical protein
MESGHWYVVVCFLLFLVVVFGGGLDGSGFGVLQRRSLRSAVRLKRCVGV